MTYTVLWLIWGSIALLVLLVGVLGCWAYSAQLQLECLQRYVFSQSMKLDDVKIRLALLIEDQTQPQEMTHATEEKT